jgi:hypothetical protein
MVGQEENFEEAAEVKKEIVTLRQDRDTAALLDTVIIILKVILQEMEALRQWPNGPPPAL